MPVLECHSQRDIAWLRPDRARYCAMMIKEIFPKNVEGFHVERVLDLGAGRGSFVNACLEKGLDACGVDMRKMGCPRFVLGDAAGLPFRDKIFDLVFQYLFLADMADLQKLPRREIELAVGEIHRILRPGGFVYNYSRFVCGDKMPHKFEKIVEYPYSETLYRKV